MTARWTFADLFSGAGGMSFGFHAHPDFELVGAVDAQLGKPSSRRGALDCNATYALNLGLVPFDHDLAVLDGAGLAALFAGRLAGRRLDVLATCPPCTGFSRANPDNHLSDDPRNSLIARTSLWVEALKPRILVMENARELLTGRFVHHHEQLALRLKELGYSVRASVHTLSRFGLPQRRERSLLLAVRHCDSDEHQTEQRSLEELWDGWEVESSALSVRRAIGALPAVPAGVACETDPMHVAPGLRAGRTSRRIEAIPKDGGSWADLRAHPVAAELLTPAMRRSLARSDLGSHPDVYGRLWWDRPSVTVKRECSHVGNGRYVHPEQDRLCTVRELALLQGFPRDYQFTSPVLANLYRHIGDAVPPLISYQLAWLCRWMFTGQRPALEQCILPGTSLQAADLRRAT